MDEFWRLINSYVAGSRIFECNHGELRTRSTHALVGLPPPAVHSPESSQELHRQEVKEFIEFKDVMLVHCSSVLVKSQSTNQSS